MREREAHDQTVRILGALRRRKEMPGITWKTFSISFLLLLQRITASLVVWNNSDLLSYISGGHKSEMSFLSPKSNYEWSDIPSGAAKGQSVFLLFLLEIVSISSLWLLPLSSEHTVTPTSAPSSISPFYNLDPLVSSQILVITLGSSRQCRIISPSQDP